MGDAASVGNQSECLAMWNEILLCTTALLAGMVNSVAGGGTLLTFPALMAALAASPSSAVLAKGVGVLANGTSTVALLPGSAVAAWEYRGEFRKAGRWFLLLLAPSVVGSLTGVLLVTRLPKETFEALVPWLILFAAILFALQPRITRWIKVGVPHERPTWPRLAGILAFQLLVALYGGYFGAGIGILMLSALALMGLADIHVMNGVKNVLATSINAVAAAVFVIGNVVDWRLCLPMMAATIVGGFLGSRIAQRSNRAIVRRVVVAIGFSLAAYYFYRQFRG
ncbi:MAG TPA: sulfite exporter TauE/SafE family protein [Pirellulales bacterium]|nr:sulfite exporter TauE/SafE family protein [Pirellulales bacterium]